MSTQGNLQNILLTILALSFAVLYLLRFIFQYQVEQHAILVKLFGRKVLRQIPIDAIEEIKVMPAWSSEGFHFRFYFVEKWPSFVFTKNVVLIRKRQGFGREVILYPQKPFEFVEQIKRAMDR